MFKKRNVKAENAAAIPSGIPRPAQTVINQASSEAALFLVKAVVTGVGLFIGWFFALYLIEELGYKNPARVMAQVIAGVVTLAVIVVATYFGVTKFFERYWDYKLQLEEIRAERDRSLALTAAQPRPNESRLTGEDSKFAALLRMVMAEAYRHLDKEGQYSYGEPKPWVRRANTGRKVPGFDDPVTEVMAGDVSRWLREKGVIDKNGVINIDEGRGYPTFAHFEALLESEFYVPIQVNKTLSPILRREVNFIENA